jgi:recombination protein RecR
LLCIVEEPADILRVESSGAFRGRYHVLHGAISPLDGVGPENLRIRELLERLDNGLSGRGPKINEIILALDPDLEGDTTVLYLAKALAEKQVKLTRIASGVPIGSDIDYVDDRTLSRALENRVEL